MGDYSLGAHAATLRDLLDRLGIDRVTLVGHSLGGGRSRLQFCYLFPSGWTAWSWSRAGVWVASVSPLLRAATLRVPSWCYR